MSPRSIFSFILHIVSFVVSTYLYEISTGLLAVIPFLMIVIISCWTSVMFITNLTATRKEIDCIVGKSVETIFGDYRVILHEVKEGDLVESYYAICTKKLIDAGKIKRRDSVTVVVSPYRDFMSLGTFLMECLFDQSQSLVLVDCIPRS